MGAGIWQKAALGLVAALTSGLPASAQTASAPSASLSTTHKLVLITADHYVDVLAGRLVPSPAIWVKDGRITAITGQSGAAFAQAKASAGEVRHIDLTGHNLVPGLIDMHVHLSSDFQMSAIEAQLRTDNYWTLVGAQNARKMLETGFTTVRSLGSSNYDDVALKQAIEDLRLPGPRIIAATYSMGATGGHCDETFYPPSLGLKSPGVADGPVEGRKKVRELRKYGAEVIKVCATGGVFSHNTEVGQQQMSEAELRAIVEEAGMWGISVAAHAHGTKGIKAALRSGVHTIEHASLLDEEAITLAKQSGAYFSMDIYNTEYTQSEGRKNGVLEDNLRKDREIAVLQREGFRKAHQAGVKMVFGSDAGVMPHDQAVRQFAVMVRYGMSPLQALQTATRNAAEALAREGDIGAIAVGRYADLVAVKGNPLEDVTVLENAKVTLVAGDVRVDRR